jgi:hypothetical protein
MGRVMNGGRRRVRQVLLAELIFAQIFMVNSA